MTQPPDPQLVLLQQSMTTLSDTVKDLTRAIQGDVNTGSPSIRASIESLRTDLTGKLDKLKTELDSETDALNERLEKLERGDRVAALEQKAREQELTLKIYGNIARWAIGSSLSALLALGFTLARFFGGHP